MYPEELTLGFDRSKWIALCERIHARDNDPLYRDEQRAWYDTLRDFLPSLQNLQPTVRLYAKDCTWCSFDPHSPEDVKKFEAVLKGTHKNWEIEFIRRSINMLGENQKILLYCILTVEDKTPTNVYRNYNMKARDLGSSPLTHRRLSALLRELELMGLVEIERRGKGRARGVEWQVYPPSTIDRETMLEVISRSL